MRPFSYLHRPGMIRHLPQLNLLGVASGTIGIGHRRQHQENFN
jgi:hypothetical protein